VRSLEPKAKPSLFPALDLARKALQSHDHGARHIFVLAYGRLPLVADNKYIHAVDNLRKDKIKVSTFSLGNREDAKQLDLLARYTKGSAYYIINQDTLKEAVLAHLKTIREHR
jgi:uncharacterized protein with von Willebrand factor type A (vWA) domain